MAVKAPFLNTLCVAQGERSSSAYGDDYLSEFDRIIRTHVRAANKNALE
ncbi:MAG TPA: hypothetical protein VGF53_08875 [Pseudolabrys sp.]